MIMMMMPSHICAWRLSLTVFAGIFPTRFNLMRNGWLEAVNTNRRYVRDWLAQSGPRVVV
jgi:hypothetical protein